MAACSECKRYAGDHCTSPTCTWLMCEKGHISKRPAKPKKENPK